MILLFLASATQPLGKCVDAVRQIKQLLPNTLEAACAANSSSGARLWDQTAGEQPACDKEREPARYAAHSQDLPPTMIAGIIRKFGSRVGPTC